MFTRTLNVSNETGDDPDPQMMREVLAHCADHLVGGYKIDIIVNTRIPSTAPPQDHPGWLMYNIAVYYKTLAPLRQTAIQRAPDAPIEVHNDREYN